MGSAWQVRHVRSLMTAECEGTSTAASVALSFLGTPAQLRHRFDAVPSARKMREVVALFAALLQRTL